MIRPVRVIWLLFSIAVLTPHGDAANAFTAADADAALHAYNRAFYVSSGSKGYFKKNTEGGRSDFWKQAEEIEMVIDAFERTRNTAQEEQIRRLIAGFSAQHGTNWLWNQYNDDLMWMTIASARAGLATGERSFGEQAKRCFDAVYQRAWDSGLGGGMWWTTNDTSKNACINGPAAIAACLLYRIYNEPLYLNRARSLFEWEARTLVDPATGRVWDHIRADGRVGRHCFTYNQGTFIGAANELYRQTGQREYYEAALRAARYAREKLSRDGLLPAYGNGDAAGFNGIFARWMARFATDQHLWGEFHLWLAKNANTAWAGRRSDDLSWHRWLAPTPDGTLDSWSCSDTVVLLQVVPPGQH